MSKWREKLEPLYLKYISQVHSGRYTDPLLDDAIGIIEGFCKEHGISLPPPTSGKAVR